MAILLELPPKTEHLMNNVSTYSVFDREANAHRTVLQRAVAVALRLPMLSLASGKSTHWFDWHYIAEPEKYEGLEIPSSKNAFDMYHPNPIIYLFNKIHMSLGGWQDTALIGPDPERNDLEELAKTGWLYGYRVFDEGNIIIDAKYSKLINPNSQSIVVLRGPRRFDAIGLIPKTLEEVHLLGIASYIRGARIQ